MPERLGGEALHRTVCEAQRRVQTAPIKKFTQHFSALALFLIFFGAAVDRSGGRSLYTHHAATMRATRSRLSRGSLNRTTGDKHPELVLGVSVFVGLALKGEAIGFQPALFDK